MIIGLTGGIGSGKTTIAKLFEVMGCLIYNSDERAKELYFHPNIKKQVVNLLGNEVYINDSEIDKKFISDKVFSNTALLQKLNAIIHPAIKNDFDNFVKNHSPKSIIIKETALLFEATNYKELDAIILVTAPIELRIQRVIKRDAKSKTEIENRITAQLPDEQKISLATYVIENDGQHALIPQVLLIMGKLKQYSTKN